MPQDNLVANVQLHRFNTLFEQLTVRIAYDRTVLGKQAFVNVMKQVRPHKKIHIFVEDTGKGIAKEKLASVFERFSGKITVNLEEGKGSRFTMVLPLRPENIFEA